MILMSTTHYEHEIAEDNEEFKPIMILDYNKTKFGADILDKLIREYTCKRATRRWPLRLFMNYIDIACYNAFVVWNTKFPNWNGNVPIKNRRKLFLQDLSEMLFRQKARKNDERRQRLQKSHL